MSIQMTPKIFGLVASAKQHGVWCEELFALILKHEESGITTQDIQNAAQAFKSQGSPWVRVLDFFNSHQTSQDKLESIVQTVFPRQTLLRFSSNELPSCIKCATPVHPFASVNRLEIGRDPLGTIDLDQAMDTHLFPVFTSPTHTQTFCDGSPSRAQYLAGQPRDTRNPYPMTGGLYLEFRSAYAAMLSDATFTHGDSVSLLTQDNHAFYNGIKEFFKLSE